MGRVAPLPRRRWFGVVAGAHRDTSLRVEVDVCAHGGMRGGTGLPDRRICETAGVVRVRNRRGSRALGRLPGIGRGGRRGVAVRARVALGEPGSHRESGNAPFKHGPGG